MTTSAFFSNPSSFDERAESYFNPNNSRPTSDSREEGSKEHVSELQRQDSTSSQEGSNETPASWHHAVSSVGDYHSQAATSVGVAQACTTLHPNNVILKGGKPTSLSSDPMVNALPISPTACPVIIDGQTLADMCQSPRFLTTPSLPAPSIPLKENPLTSSPPARKHFPLRQPSEPPSWSPAEKGASSSTVLGPQSQKQCLNNNTSTIPSLPLQMPSAIAGYTLTANETNSTASSRIIPPNVTAATPSRTRGRQRSITMPFTGGGSRTGSVVWMAGFAMAWESTTPT